CEPRALGPKVGTAALLQHGTQYFFGSVFCSVGVKSSDRFLIAYSVCIAMTIFVRICLREASTPASALSFLLPSEQALTSRRACRDFLARLAKANGARWGQSILALLCVA